MERRGEVGVNGARTRDPSFHIPPLFFVFYSSSVPILYHIMQFVLILVHFLCFRRDGFIQVDVNGNNAVTDQTDLGLPCII